jgi:hypothetical protein
MAFVNNQHEMGCPLSLCDEARQVIARGVDDADGDTRAIKVELIVPTPQERYRSRRYIALEKIRVPLTHERDGGHHDNHPKFAVTLVSQPLSGRKGEERLATAGSDLDGASAIRQPDAQALLLPSVELDARGNEAPRCVLLFMGRAIHVRHTFAIRRIIPVASANSLSGCFCHGISRLELKQLETLFGGQLRAWLEFTHRYPCLSAC